MAVINCPLILLVATLFLFFIKDAYYNAIGSRSIRAYVNHVLRSLRKDITVFYFLFGFAINLIAF